MAKRSPSHDSDSNSGDEECKPTTSKKQRLVHFQPIRLVSVNSVTDMNSRVSLVKLRNIQARLKSKNRQLEEEKKKNLMLTARQDKDDNTLCMLNRHWNKLDEELRLLLARSGSGEDVPAREGEGESSADFLNKISELDDDDAETHYDARVKHSMRLAKRLSEIEVNRSDQYYSCIKKLKAFMAGAENADPEELSKDLTCKLADMAEQSKAANRMAHKLQTENREISLKLTERDDKIALLTTKNEELLSALNEKDYEIQECWNREEKLAQQLSDMDEQIKNASKDVAREPINGIPLNDAPADISQRNLEDLQREYESCKETLASRLQEMNDLNEKNAQLVADLEEARNNLKTIPSATIRVSDEYKTMQAYYSILADELESAQQELDGLREQMCEIRQNHDAEMERMEKEEELRQEALAQNARDNENTIKKMREEYDQLRIEFEQALTATELNGGPNAFDYRATIGTLNNQIQLMRSEAAKFKKKWNQSVNQLAKLQRDTDLERKKLDGFILVPLEDVYVKELDEIKRKYENSSVKMNGSNGDGVSSPNGEMPKSYGADYELRRLEAERASAVLQLNVLLAPGEKEKLWADDAARKIEMLDSKVEDLEEQLRQKIADEEALIADSEATGNAFEELQEENSKLLVQIKEQEEQHLKVMSDRIYMSAATQKLKEEKTLGEDQLSNLNKIVATLQTETSANTKTTKAYLERIHQMGEERRKEQTQMEKLRRLQFQESKRCAEMKVQFEKCSTQLNEVQTAMKSKLTGHEKDEYRINRLEEDKSILKKKLERAKKAEVLGSSDTVLLEEIKELKDALTCPSCKVRRKDGILTKCFHVFCMDCLKSRYEARRRKCPKCNTAFGQHDFHRAYIE